MPKSKLFRTYHVLFGDNEVVPVGKRYGYEQGEFGVDFGKSARTQSRQRLRNRQQALPGTGNDGLVELSPGTVFGIERRRFPNRWEQPTGRTRSPGRPGDPSLFRIDQAGQVRKIDKRKEAAPYGGTADYKFRRDFVGTAVRVRPNEGIVVNPLAQGIQATRYQPGKPAKTTDLGVDYKQPRRRRK